MPAGTSQVPAKAPASPDLLAKFHAALHDLKSRDRKLVTVLHLGDSHVAGDYLSGAMRVALQARYGNAGRGLIQVPAYKYFRVDGAKITLGGDWQLLNSRTDTSEQTYGLTGVATRSTKTGDSVSATSPGAKQIAFQYLNQPNSGTIEVAYASKVREIVTKGDVALKAQTVPGDTIKLSAKSDDPITILGIEFRTLAPGVMYQSLGIPSATAQVIDNWNPAYCKAQLEQMNPSLVIFAFGVNEAFSESVDIDAWKVDVRKNIDALHKLTPHASWVIAGPSDAQRDHGEGETCLAPWVTPSHLEVVRAHLSTIATDIGALFWDWQKEMGGPCSMPKWIEAGDGRGDHVHFTEAGYTKLGNMLLNAILPKT